MSLGFVGEIFGELATGTVFFIVTWEELAGLPYPSPSPGLTSKRQRSDFFVNDLPTAVRFRSDDC